MLLLAARRPLQSKNIKWVLGIGILGSLGIGYWNFGLVGYWVLRFEIDSNTHRLGPTLGGGRLCGSVGGRTCVARVQHCQMYLRASREPPVVDVRCPSGPAESYCSQGPQPVFEKSSGPQRLFKLSKGFVDRPRVFCPLPAAPPC